MTFDITAYEKIEPRTSEMEQKDEKNAAENGGTWLWDNEEAEDFLAEEIARDGKPFKYFGYAHWLGLRMKFLKGRCLDLAEQYIRTQQRDLSLEIAGESMFGWLYRLGSSYPEAFLYACLEETDDQPGTYDPPWDYKDEDGDFSHLFNPQDIRENIVLGEDRQSYRKMTKEEWEAAHPKRQAAPFPKMSVEELMDKIKGYEDRHRKG